MRDEIVLVTFFDSNYLPKAIEMYKSLERVSSNFHLYSYCFDELSYEVMKSLNFKRNTPIKDFEPANLLATKLQKQKKYEYYWAFKAYLILKTMKDTGAKSVAYIDCDVRFFENPNVIFEELGEQDVLIQPNNFSSEESDQFVPVGYYCSGFVYSKNNTNGRKIMNWWYKKCVEWCNATFEEGKFADQKYLDSWRWNFKKVREVTEIGANIAPWSINKYDVSKKSGHVLLNDKHKLIYYHYHSFKMNIDDYTYIITGDRENYYSLGINVTEYIYNPYIKELKAIIKSLKRFPGYRKYVLTNPKSKVHATKEGQKLTFSTFKSI